MNNNSTKIPKAVLLDRDGVINVADPKGYILNIGDLEVLPGVGEAIARLNEAGYAVIVISNQQAVGKGLLSIEDLNAMSEAIRGRVALSGGKIADFLYCTHLASENCGCRKPRPGLIQEAAARFGFDTARTFFIGDNYGDLATAGNAGCRAIFISSGVDSERYSQGCPFPFNPEFVAANLAEAVDWLLAAEPTPLA